MVIQTSIELHIDCGDCFLGYAVPDGREANLLHNDYTVIARGVAQIGLSSWRLCEVVMHVMLQDLGAPSGQATAKKVSVFGPNTRV